MAGHAQRLQIAECVRATGLEAMGVPTASQAMGAPPAAVVSALHRAFALAVGTLR